VDHRLATWGATAEERARALPPSRGALVIRDLRRPDLRRDLLAVFETATGVAPSPLRGVTDNALVARIEGAFSTGRLLLIPAAELGGAGTSSAAPGEALVTDEDRVVKVVMGDRAVIEFERGRYRFLARARWTGKTGARGYRALPATEARALVTLMAARFAKTPDEQAGASRSRSGPARSRRRTTTSRSPGPRC